MYLWNSDLKYDRIKSNFYYQNEIMKFQLTEPNKQYSNAELIEDIQRVANELGKNSVSQREYDKLGNFSYQTLKKRFGSWCSAQKKAGLEQSKRSWGGDL